MSKIILSAVGIALMGMAGAASADQDEPRRATMRGRQVVWEAPRAERPFALTGEREQKAEERKVLRPQGRAGFTRR